MPFQVLTPLPPYAAAAGPSLLVARGSTVKPAFSTLAVPKEAGDDVMVSLAPQGGVLLPGKGGAQGDKASTSGAAAGGAQDKSAQQQARQRGGTAANLTVLGADNIGQPVVSRAAAEAAASGRKRTAESDDPAAAAQGTAAGAGAGEEEVPDLPDGEVPLGERVAALADRAAAGPAAVAAGPASGEGEEAGPSGAMPAGSSKADSLSVLLTQAIRRWARGGQERQRA